jgi:putative ABC transport system permease protein
MEHATGYFEDKRPLDTWEQIKDNFMRYSYNELECSLVSYQSFEEVSPKWGDKYVFANLSGLTQYSDEISEWDIFSQKEGNYILIPDNANQSEVIKEIMETGNLLGLDEENLEGVYTYKEELSVIAEGYLDGEFDYTYKIKNPVILLDTYDYGALPTYPVSYELREADHPDGMIAHNFSYLMQFVTLENNQELIYDFANKISGEAINPSLVEFTIINIGDWFKGLWSLQNRSMLIAVILTLLILILEMQISSLSLRIAYETNAKELTIKKVMGYSIFERFKSFFLLTGVLCGISLVGALLCTIIFKIGATGYIAWGSIIAFLLDIDILLYLTRKNDNLQIQKVLKGGI